MSYYFLTIRALLVAGALLFVVPAAADIVYLRGGKTLDGTIVWQNPRAVGLHMDGATKVIDKGEIVRIVFGDPEKQRKQLAEEEAARVVQEAEAKRRADAEAKKRAAIEAQRRAQEAKRREAEADRRRKEEAELAAQKNEAKRVREQAAAEESRAADQARERDDLRRLRNQFAKDQEEARILKEHAGQTRTNTASAGDKKVETDGGPTRITLVIAPVTGTVASELEKKTARDRQVSGFTLSGGGGANLPWTNRRFRGGELGVYYEPSRWFAAYEFSRITSRPTLTGFSNIDTTIATLPASITFFDKARMLKQERTVQNAIVGQDITLAGRVGELFTRTRIFAGYSTLSNQGPYQYDTNSTIQVLTVSGQSTSTTVYAMTNASAKGPLLGFSLEKALPARFSLTGRCYVYSQDGTWRSRLRSVQYGQILNSSSSQVKIANEDSRLVVNGRRVDIGGHWDMFPRARLTFSYFEDKSVYGRSKVSYIGPDSGNPSVAAGRVDFLSRYLGGTTADRVEGVKFGVELDLNL